MVIFWPYGDKIYYRNLFHLFLFTFNDVATRKFRITYMVQIILLIDSTGPEHSLGIRLKFFKTFPDDSHVQPRLRSTGSEKS